MEKTNHSILEPNKLIAVIGYAFLTIFGGAFLIIIAAFLYNKAAGYNLSYTELIQLIGETNFTKIDIEYQRLYVISNALGNMLSYLFMLAIVGFFMRNYLLEDGKAFLKEYKRLLWMIPLFAVVGYGASYLVDFLITLLINETSLNQSSIQDLIVHGGAIPMFIAVVICAPIVEELIYRKAVFEYLKKYHIAISYVVSILLFALPHMITTFISSNFTPLNNLLLSIPYAFSGFLLCGTYHLCNKNIYASWFMHMINNLLAFILILALGV